MPVKLIIVLIAGVCLLLGVIGLALQQPILMTFGFGSGSFLFAVGQNT